jgi:hypothetical protein
MTWRSSKRAPLQLDSGPKPRRGPWASSLARRRSRPAGELGHHGRSQEDRHHVRRRALFFFLVGGIEALLIRLQLAARTARCCRRTCTTRCSRCTASRWSSSWSCRWQRRSPTTCCRCRSAPVTSRSPASTPCRSGAGSSAHLLQHVVVPRRRRRRRLVQLRAELRRDLLAEPRHRLLRDRPADHRHRLAAVGAVNLIVTVLNMRAPGMTLMKMPVFTWMALVTQFLLLFAMPVITVALFLLMFDRLFGANFFDVGKGADPLLWQHLFWIFGHPEVYIMILPASASSPRSSRCSPASRSSATRSWCSRASPSASWAGACGRTTCSPRARADVGGGRSPLATMFIAVPTGVKILNWMATMWGGKLKFTTAMLFSIGLVVHVHHRRPVRRDPRHRPGRHPADRHLLHRRPLPLRAVRRRPARPVRGFYFWWPKIFGTSSARSWQVATSG